MRLRSLAFAALGLAALTACVPRTVPPTPTPPPPAPPPVEQPAPPPAPAPLDWQDAPPTPGDWSYRQEGDGSVAAFGTPQAPSLLLRCEAGRSIALVRIGGAGSAMTIRTTYGARALPSAPRGEGLVASLSPADPLLDQMVFSRGRFAVEASGAPLLVVPAWPEAARVVEDCRA